MDTVPQTINCVDVLPNLIDSESTLASHLLWTSLEPGHCHWAVCLMEPHMNISKPSVNKSNTGVRTLISHHRRRTLVTLKILFFVEQKNARCMRLGRSVVRLLFIRVMVGVIMVKVMFGLWLEVGD